MRNPIVKVSSQNASGPKFHSLASAARQHDPPTTRVHCVRQRCLRHAEIRLSELDLYNAAFLCVHNPRVKTSVKFHVLNSIDAASEDAVVAQMLSNRGRPQEEAATKKAAVHLARDANYDVPMTSPPPVIRSPGLEVPLDARLPPCGKSAPHSLHRLASKAILHLILQVLLHHFDFRLHLRYS